MAKKKKAKAKRTKPQRRDRFVVGYPDENQSAFGLGRTPSQVVPMTREQAGIRLKGMLKSARVYELVPVED